MFDHKLDGSALGEEQIKLLTLVDIFEPLAREEIEEIKWDNLNTSIKRGEIFYTPMDLCETLFVLQKGRIRLYRATPEGREFTLTMLQSGTVFGERSEEHTSELQSRQYLVCRLLLEKKKHSPPA